jgi:hypothetical protein
MVMAVFLEDALLLWPAPGDALSRLGSSDRGILRRLLRQRRPEERYRAVSHLLSDPNPVD